MAYKTPIERNRYNNTQIEACEKLLMERIVQEVTGYKPKKQKAKTSREPQKAFPWRKSRW